MSQTHRRIYYLSAILVFAVISPLVVAWTSGYRWQGWPVGFVRASSLSVVSNPRAELVLNGRSIGQTPLRLTHLTPGPYTVELRKPGLASWKVDIRLAADTALIIGPVQLFHRDFTSQVFNSSSDTAVVSSPELTSISGAGNRGASWAVRSLWPKPSPSEILLPWQPIAVRSSPNGSVSVFQGTDQTAIVTSVNKSPWLVDHLADAQWESSADNLIYALQDGHIVRLDALEQGAETLGLATSFRIAAGSIWMTQTTAATTVILKQKTFGQVVPDTVMELPGVWQFITGPANSLLMQEAATKNVTEVSVNAVTTQTTSRNFGVVDRLWWTSLDQPPVWQRGADVLTLDPAGHETLIDRTSSPLLIAAWILPRHILLTFNGTALTIRGVSDRQGYGLILEHRFDTPAALVGLNINNRAAVVQTGLSPWQLTMFGW